MLHRRITEFEPALAAAGQDADGEGICDRVDQCPHSENTPGERSRSVVIAGCQTNLPNHLLPTGCTINDHIAACAAGKMRFADCLSGLTAELLQAGNISSQEKQRLDQCTAPAKMKARHHNLES